MPAAPRPIRIAAANLRTLEYYRAPMRRLAITILALSFLAVPLFSQNTPGDRAGGDAQILNAEDVLAVLNVAAAALGNDTMAAAVRHAWVRARRTDARSPGARIVIGRHYHRQS